MTSKIDMSLDDIIKQDRATLVLENKQKTGFPTDHNMGNQKDLRHRIQQSRTAGYHIQPDLGETVDSNQGKSPLLVSPETSHQVIQQMLRRKIQENKAESVAQETLKRNNEQNKLLGMNEKNHFVNIRRKKYKKGNQKRLLENLAHTSAMLAQIALQKTARLEKRINRQQLLAARRKRQNRQLEAAARPVATSKMDTGFQGTSTPREEHDVVVYDLDNCGCEDSVTDNLTVSFPNSPVRSGAQTPVASNRNMIGLKRTLSVASLNSVPSFKSEVCSLPEEPSCCSNIFKHQAIFPQAATSGQTLHERFSKGPSTSTSFAFQQ